VGTLRGVHKTGQTVLHTLNERLCLRGIPRRHSAQYALFHPESAEMLIASAGMPGPVLIRDGRCESLVLPGMPPGLFPNTTYDDFTVKLQRGDSLLFCTDGVIDARNRQDQEFGLEGLPEVCSHHPATPLGLLEQVFAAVQDFTKDCRQWDDMTAAVFHYPST
jgi:phosphoserine phosphatase RsbU/P